jgi:hypothetical protein
MTWLPGPKVDPRRSLWWFVRTGTTRIYHKAVPEGGQGHRWMATKCGRMFTLDKVTVRMMGDGPPTYGRLCRHCE